MPLQLYMVGLIAENVDKSREFYRRLGVGFPEASAGQTHIEARMSGGLTFFLNARGRIPELDEARVILEFYMESRSAVDAKYNELTAYGYQSYHAPYVSSIGMYFALVNDPDGNTVLLSAD